VIGMRFSCSFSYHVNLRLSLGSRSTVSPHVTGVSGSCSKRQTSRAAAEAAFARALEKGLVRLVA
jgi:hypothetical protein